MQHWLQCYRGGGGGGGEIFFSLPFEVGSKTRIGEEYQFVGDEYGGAAAGEGG